MNNILSKIKFFLGKPRMVVVVGNKNARNLISRVLNQSFPIGKDVLLFETEDKNLDKFSFFFKNSKLPVLVLDDINQVASLENLPINTRLVLNYDKEVHGLSDFKTLKFGFNEKNDVFASDIKLNGGINFKVNYKGGFVPFWTVSLNGTDYQKQIYPVLAAVCVGTIFGLNLVEISQLLK